VKDFLPQTGETAAGAYLPLRVALVVAHLLLLQTRVTAVGAHLPLQVALAVA